jgi:hypothetical protein
MAQVSFPHERLTGEGPRDGRRTGLLAAYRRGWADCLGSQFPLVDGVDLDLARLRLLLQRNADLQDAALAVGRDLLGLKVSDSRTRWLNEPIGRYRMNSFSSSPYSSDRIDEPASRRQPVPAPPTG